MSVKTKAALFCDGNDIVKFFAKNSKKFFDWNSFVTYLETLFDFETRKMYYTAQHSQPETLLSVFKNLGFETHYKQTTPFRAGESRVFFPQFYQKLTIDAMTEDSEVFVFAVTSPTYLPLIQQLRNEGKTVYLAGGTTEDSYAKPFVDQVNLLDLTPVLEAESSLRGAGATN